MDLPDSHDPLLSEMVAAAWSISAICDRAGGIPRLIEPAGLISQYGEMRFSDLHWRARCVGCGKPPELSIFRNERRRLYRKMVRNAG